MRDNPDALPQETLQEVVNKAISGDDLRENIIDAADKGLSSQPMPESQPDIGIGTERNDRETGRNVSVDDMVAYGFAQSEADSEKAPATEVDKTADTEVPPADVEPPVREDFETGPDPAADIPVETNTVTDTDARIQDVAPTESNGTESPDISSSEVQEIYDAGADSAEAQDTWQQDATDSGDSPPGDTDTPSLSDYIDGFIESYTMSDSNTTEWGDLFDNATDSFPDLTADEFILNALDSIGQYFDTEQIDPFEALSLITSLAEDVGGITGEPMEMADADSARDAYEDFLSTLSDTFGSQEESQNGTGESSFGSESSRGDNEPDEDKGSMPEVRLETENDAAAAEAIATSTDEMTQGEYPDMDSIRSDTEIMETTPQTADDTAKDVDDGYSRADDLIDTNMDSLMDDALNASTSADSAVDSGASLQDSDSTTMDDMSMDPISTDDTEPTGIDDTEAVNQAQNFIEQELQDDDMDTSYADQDADQRLNDVSNNIPENDAQVDMDQGDDVDYSGRNDVDIDLPDY